MKKFNIGDKVFIIYNGKIMETLVEGINIYLKQHTKEINYYLRGDELPSGGYANLTDYLKSYWLEDELFTSKEELINSL